MWEDIDIEIMYCKVREILWWMVKLDIGMIKDLYVHGIEKYAMALIVLGSALFICWCMSFEGN